MRKFVLFLGLFLSCMILFSSPVIASMQSHEPKDNTDIEKVSNPVVIVKGGVGIDITVYGADKDTAISTAVSGAISNAYANYLSDDRVHIHISTFKLLPGTIELSIYVGDYLFTYQCRSIFIVFVFGINPVNTS